MAQHGKCAHLHAPGVEAEELVVQRPGHRHPQPGKGLGRHAGGILRQHLIKEPPPLPTHVPADLQALWLQTHYDNAAEVGPDEAVECNVDATIVAQGAGQVIVAVGTVAAAHGDPPSDCFAGRREYRLSGGAFVAAP